LTRPTRTVFGAIPDADVRGPCPLTAARSLTHGASTAPAFTGIESCSPSCTARTPVTASRPLCCEPLRGPRWDAQRPASASHCFSLPALYFSTSMQLEGENEHQSRCKTRQLSTRRVQADSCALLFAVVLDIAPLRDAFFLATAPPFQHNIVLQKFVVVYLLMLLSLFRIASKASLEFQAWHSRLFEFRITSSSMAIGRESRNQGSLRPTDVVGIPRLAGKTAQVSCSSSHTNIFMFPKRTHIAQCGLLVIRLPPS
jgi:hypothetical protein